MNEEHLSGLFHTLTLFSGLMFLISLLCEILQASSGAFGSKWIVGK